MLRTLLRTTCVSLAIVTAVSAQEQTVGLFQNDAGAFDGYTLFNPLVNTTTYLIDNDGFIVNSWENSFLPGNSIYLLESGHLLRTTDPANNQVIRAGGDGGLVQLFDWDGVLVWQYLYSNSRVRQHHDIAPLPNGNVLILAWERLTAADAIAAGRDPAKLTDGELWPEHVVEVRTDTASAEIVWEWRLWDHLIQDFDSTKANYGVIADHPERIDLNFAADSSADWIHANALDYNAELDQIMINSPRFNEFWVIDHSTTTEEAAGSTGGASGRGGDILYRWGNPLRYGAGDSSAQQLFAQHDAHWIRPGLPGAGNILVFNNGNGRPGGNFSSIVEITTPVDAQGVYAKSAGAPFGPDTLVWEYAAPVPGDFFSSFISGAQRLENGNTLICFGAKGTFFEVTPAGEKVWEYVNPVTNQGPLRQGEEIPFNMNNGRYGNPVFRATRYAAGYAAFSGRDLTPGGTVELSPATSVSDAESGTVRRFALRQNTPNPFNPKTRIRFELTRQASVTLSVFDARGRAVATVLADENFAAGEHVVGFRADNLPSGVYFYRMQAGAFAATRKMVLLR